MRPSVPHRRRDEREREAVEEFASRHDLDVAGVVPFDEAMPASERAESSPLDYAPDSPAVQAIARLAQAAVHDG